MGSGTATASGRDSILFADLHLDTKKICPNKADGISMELSFLTKRLVFFRHADSTE